MARILAALIGGLLLGAAVTYTLVARDEPGAAADEVVRDIVDLPKMTDVVVEQHRDDGFERLSTIEDVFSLPTDFTRAEALYALAGRSDAAAVQNLIFDANRIADDIEREAALGILFYRLAEEDPESALAVARTEYFRGVKSIEQTVWRAWARKDFEDALFAAKTQTTLGHQNSAAQSLYVAFGYMGNEITDRIEAELGISPDRSARGRYLYRLADDSPATAIAFINNHERGTEQQEYVSWLAYYVSLRDPVAALGYADLFRVDSDARRYKSIIDSNVARENPQATIERLLAGGGNMRRNNEFYSAISALTSTDIDAAKQYFEQARSAEDRQTIGSAIATQLARTDPAEALRWARENDRPSHAYLEATVLAAIAETEPQLALAEAMNIQSPQARSNAISSIIQQVSRNNPADAAAYLDQIVNSQQRQEAAQQLAFSWMRRDPDAALDWVLSQDSEISAPLLSQAGYMLMRTDLDAAIRVLPRIDDEHQESWRQQIAQQLATNRSPGEAQNFIQQFQGQPGYDQLQASLIAGVAQSDTMMAKQLADQLANGDARDRAYVQVVAQRAQTNPTEAAGWISGIADEHMRGTATAQLAQQWYANDPVLATRWVSNLPSGPARDQAIVQLSYQWREPTDEQMELIAGIEDRDKRSQAKIRRIYNLVRSNPARARELLQDQDISDQHRTQVESMLSQYASRY